MEYVIEFVDDGPPDVTITTSGIADVDGFSRFIADVAADPRWRAGMSVLLDHSALEVGRVTAEDMRAVGDAAVRLGSVFGSARAAVVAPAPAAFGLARVSEVHLSDSDVDSNVFYSRAEAEAWLRREP